MFKIVKSDANYRQIEADVLKNENLAVQRNLNYCKKVSSVKHMTEIFNKTSENPWKTFTEGFGELSNSSIRPGGKPADAKETELAQLTAQLTSNDQHSNITVTPRPKHRHTSRRNKLHKQPCFK